MAELTPMMKQYLEIKEQNKDSILFFRLGDFYEMFGADARTASRELDLTLTTRDKDKNKSFDEKVPMCGVPYHSSDGYIARLIAKGYKVAICEQTEDPATAKGLVKRDIIRVVTPGTVLDDTSLEAGRSNFCAAAWLGRIRPALPPVISPPARPMPRPFPAPTPVSTCSMRWPGFPRRRSSSMMPLPGMPPCRCSRRISSPATGRFARPMAPPPGPASPPNSGNRPFRTSLPIITLLSWPWAIF